ncbi:MAG: hypothetical protein H6827_09795 [Planctomycetes bacterium]|nr:hypothetical protein [Planctomycetota bacterium]
MIQVDYLKELRSRKRVLRVNSSFHWFDMVASGEKREEYRGIHWMSRILRPEAFIAFEFIAHKRHGLIPAFHVEPVVIEIVRGYTPIIQQFAIDQVRWGLPRREWSGQTIANECFGFKLGEQLCLT